MPDDLLARWQALHQGAHNDHSPAADAFFGFTREDWLEVAAIAAQAAVQPSAGWEVIPTPRLGELAAPGLTRQLPVLSLQAHLGRRTGSDEAREPYTESRVLVRVAWTGQQVEAHAPHTLLTLHPRAAVELAGLLVKAVLDGLRVEEARGPAEPGTSPDSEVGAVGFALLDLDFGNEEDDEDEDRL